MKTNDSFVYCWTDHRTQMLYVGSHKGHIDDGYVCSSKYMMEEYSKRPEDFTRQIVAEGAYEDILKLEEVILTRVDARMNEQFYNQHNGNGKFFLKCQTQSARRKISESKMGDKNHNHHSKLTEEKKLWFKELGKMQRGIRRTAEQKENYSESKKGSKNPNYGKKGCFDHINNQKHTCENCGFETTLGNYKRWHGTNCKRIKHE